jgi:RHS repeat-associated protein
VTDALDSGTCAANADSREVTNAYDALGRLLSATVTDGPNDGDAPTTATYDSVGNTLTSWVTVDAETSTTTFSRDALDQVTAELREDGSAAKTTYDPVGNSVDRCSWAADGPGIGDCLAVGSAGWTDPPTSSTSTRWDARNGRIGLTDAATNRTTVYDPEHAYQTSATYLPTIADQTREHQSLYDYDERHRLVSITHQLCTVSSGHACSSTSATGSVAYEYDEADSRSRVTEANGSASSDYRYCHDARGQLTGRGSTTSCTTSNVENFAFDDAGNRTQAVEGGVTRNFAYTDAGLLCDVETGSAASCTGGNITSDDAGRISDVGGWHYEYDAEGRLVSACEDADCVGSGFDRLDFVYDGEGHRTAITETPASGPVSGTVFRYQGSAIVAEERDGDAYREYVVDDTGTISKVIIPAGVTGTGSYLVTWNGHGDAMALWRIETDGSLTLANSYTYSTWGAPTTATHNSIADLGFRFLYVGAADVQWDDAYGLGLLYMHARHYSPSLGRFLQPDPSRLDEQLFVYAGNGPVSRVDPEGKCPAIAAAVIPYAGWTIAGASCLVALGGLIAIPVGAFVISLTAGTSTASVRSVARWRAADQDDRGRSYRPRKRLVMIGETARRVAGCGLLFNAWTYTPRAKDESVWMANNRRWIRERMRERRVILDIGYDPRRSVRGQFYQMERHETAGYPLLVRLRNIGWCN